MLDYALQKTYDLKHFIGGDNVYLEGHLTTKLQCVLDVFLKYIYFYYLEALLAKIRDAIKLISNSQLGMDDTQQNQDDPPLPILFPNQQ